MKTAGITGGSGYIGSYITRKFLEEGYKVKVGTTDASNKDKYGHLLDLPANENLEIVELDVRDKSQLEPFLAGCSMVIHSGTPFQLDVNDPQTELLDPTIRGTENFLELIQNTPGIEKVVFVASVAALNTNFPFLPEGKVEGDQVDESDPPFISEDSNPYRHAKYYANQAVIKFIADHPESDVEITTVSPVSVIGRALSQREDSVSVALQVLYKDKIAPNPTIQMYYDNDIYLTMVDVEDVAEGTFRAATRSGLHGKNYLLTSESYKVSDVTMMLNNREPVGKPKIIYRNSLAKKELEMDFKPVQVSLNQFSE